MFKPNILLIDSSTISLEIQKKYLRSLEANIFTSSGIEEAMRIARKVKPSLIYLAFGIPEGGPLCCRTLKCDPDLQSIPVIAICSESGDEPRLSREAGSNAVVAKPLDRKQFLETGLSLLAGVVPGNDRVSCRAVVSVARGSSKFYGTIEDISTGGMYIGSTREVAAGDLLALEFELPWSGADRIAVHAKITWINGIRRKRNERLPSGFGVIFQDPPEAVKDQLRDYLELMRVRLGR